MRILFLILLLCFSAPLLFAQQDKKAGDSLVKARVARSQVYKSREDANNKIRFERAAKYARVLTDSLGLSSAQQNEIATINKSLELQKANAFRDTSRAQVGAKLQQIENQRDQQYRSVLTEQQFQRYLSFKTNNRGTLVKKPAIDKKEPGH